MNNIFFTSDTHFGHRLMLNAERVRARPWASLEEMNEGLIENWNSTVSERDTVYHLGDFSFLKSGPTLDVLRRLNGKIHLIRGNHDKSLNQYILAHFASVSDLKEVRVGEYRIICSHYALMTWDKMYRGSWMLHGHSHGSLPCDLTKRRLDVGVDTPRANYRAVAFDRLEREMQMHGFTPIDHHGENYQD